MGRNYQICSHCILDTNDDPNIQFDESGKCNYCKTYETVVIKYVFTGEVGKQKLAEIIEKIKRDGLKKEYDCIVGVSGGVDSTYLASQAKKLGLRPLVVHLDNGWNTELAVSNIENIIKKLEYNLHTYVINWEEFKDLQLAYLKASVVDIEVVTDHSINASLYKLARKYGVKYILNGANYATEGFLPDHWRYNKNDLKNLKAIHKRFGTIKLNTYPKLGFLKSYYYNHILKIKFVFLLNLMTYNKQQAKRIIMEELDWRDYGYKHYESVFTRFYQAYILPRKFNIDKRKSHLSTLICSGQLTREEALKSMEQPIYNKEKLIADKEYVIKKLGLTASEFDAIMKLPVKQHTDYPHAFNIYKMFSRLKSIYIRLCS